MRGALMGPLKPRVHGQTIFRATLSQPSPEAGEGAMTRCGSERHSNQYANPPNTIDASHEKSTPLVAREIGPWNSDTPPYSNTHPATSAASERQALVIFDHPYNGG